MKTTSFMNGTFVNVTFKEFDFTDKNLMKTKFINCKFDNCITNGACFMNSEMINCDFIAVPSFRPPSFTLREVDRRDIDHQELLRMRQKDKEKEEKAVFSILKEIKSMNTFNDIIISALFLMGNNPKMRPLEALRISLTKANDYDNKQEDYVLKDRKRDFDSALHVILKSKLSSEMILSALSAMSDNPTLTAEEALQYGFEEWMK